MTAPASSTERQLELTLNAVARNFRKTLRAAEKQNPAGAGELWRMVEQRAKLLQDMMAACASFLRRGQEPPATQPQGETQPEPALPPATQPETEGNAARLATAITALKKLAPAQPAAAKPKKLAPAKELPATSGKHAVAPVTQTAGKGWRVVA